jgi:hypothetical protein
LNSQNPIKMKDKILITTNIDKPDKANWFASIFKKKPSPPPILHHSSGGSIEFNGVSGYIGISAYPGTSGHSMLHGYGTSGISGISGHSMLPGYGTSGISGHSLPRRPHRIPHSLTQNNNDDFWSDLKEPKKEPTTISSISKYAIMGVAVLLGVSALTYLVKKRR